MPHPEAFITSANRWLADYSNDVVKPPRIIPLRHGLDGYELMLDSPLGYESQGTFESVKEALDRGQADWDVYWR